MPTLYIPQSTLIDLIRQMEEQDVEWFIKDLDKLVNSTQMAINLANYFADETRHIRSIRPEIHESFMRHVKLEE